ncbi:MAG TPA: hypothetical protein PK314_08425 [Deltaproteobacteria bacterium]|nr:hypothetical protein [Deltaproteobacteria bacterium]
MTVMLFVASPPGPAAVIVYVVVAVGAMVVEPLRSTAPIPLSMLTLSACSDVQMRIEDSPPSIAPGSAEILTTGGW